MKRHLKKSLSTVMCAVVCILFISSFIPELNAQTNNIVISGTVTDQMGEPLIGVNVTQKGTTNGTITDFNGKYSLTITTKNAVLAFSYIGYVTQEIQTGNNTIVNVKLSDDTQNLDEVIVVGYGTMKKSDLTGAVARVTLDDKSSLPNVNLAQALSGASAGVSVQQSGSAGGDVKLSIRGQTSLSAKEDPLIVLDGIIYNGSISSININDIEYIDILKDASSAAVYGSRSANGVVIITTKKGKTDKPRVSFNSYYGVQGMANNPMKVMNAEQYAIRMVDYYYQQDLYAWYKTNPTSATDRPARPDITNREVVANRLRTEEEKESYLKGTDIDWVDRVMRDNPTIQSYDASFSGKSDKVNYYASASYLSEEGYLKNNQYERYTLNAKVDGKLNSWLSLGLNLNYSFQDKSGLPIDLNHARAASPLASIEKDEFPVKFDKHLTGENYMPHPLSRTLALHEDLRNNLFSVLTAKVEVPFVKGLTYDFNYSNTYYNKKENRFYPETIDEGYANKGKAEKRPADERSWIFNNILTYIRSFGQHNLNATLLYSREKFSGDSYILTVEGFDNPILGFNNLMMGTKYSSSEPKAWEENGVSYMGRLNYQYMNRYMASATVRRDGFSGFGANSKFVTLPSFSVGWIASEESFMESMPWLYLKLRGSYGQNGNQGIGRYSSIAQMSSGAYVNGSSTAVTVFPDKMGNPSLAWEKTTSYNLGLDFGFLDRRISGSIDMYTAETSDVLVERKLALSAGYEKVWTNIGGLNNKGIDIELKTLNIDSKDFKWNSGFVFSLNRDKITKLYGGKTDFDLGNSWFVEKPILSIYDYKPSGGIYQEEDFFSGNILNGWYPGQYKYEDLNKDGKIDPENDRTIVGNKAPNYRFSISNTFTYKNFSLYVMLNSIQGGNGYYMLDNYNVVNTAKRSDDVYRTNQSAVRPYWTPENKVNNTTGIYNSPAATPAGIYEDRSFVRLQDVSLSYNFSPKTLKALGRIEALQLYVAGKNLYTWTKWSGWDPELASLDTEKIPHLPAIRSITCGLKLSF